MKHFVLFILIIVLISCSGRKPEANWTPEEYFHYAKDMYANEDYLEAVNEFTVIILRFPGSSVADSAQYYLGMSHYQLEEYLIASEEFKKLVNEMSRSHLVSESQFMLAMSYYEMSPRAELDQEYTEKALKEFQILLEDFPTYPEKEKAEKLLLELREKLAEKQLRNAEIYRKMREYQASIIYYDIVLSRYYDTEHADDAQYGKALAYFDWEDWQNAKQNLLIFKEKYKDSDLMEDVDAMLVEIEKIEEENSDITGSEKKQ